MFLSRFLKILKPSSPPLLGCIPLTKPKYFYHCSIRPCFFLHLHHHKHPPLLSAAQDRQRKKHSSSLKIENISSASNHSDSLSWAVTLSEAFDLTFKNKLQLQPAILGSTWSHSTPHSDTLKLLNDAEWLKSSLTAPDKNCKCTKCLCEFTLHATHWLRMSKSRTDGRKRLPGSSLTRSRNGVCDGEIILLW